MKDKDRDSIDDLFRSKLYDFETETSADDWEKIAGRLPRKSPVPFYRKAPAWVAAAVITLLLMVGSLYMFEQKPESQPIVQEIQKQTDELKNRMAEELKTPSPEQKTAPTVQTIVKETITRVIEPLKEVQEEPVTVREQDIDEPIEDEIPVVSEVADTPRIGETEKKMLTADASVPGKARQAQARKWGFGMGAGSFAVSSDNVVPGYVTNSPLRSESLLVMNAADFENQLSKTDIKHKTPVSFGIGVSRYLNDRFSLQTGITYTYLSSEWKTSGRYHALEKQKLHFIGIPISVSYKITEWNRFLVYASAGVMGEINVSGQLKSKLLMEERRDDIELAEDKINKRMTEPLFSVNAHLGVSYPVFRYLSAYGEVGSAYYFDNGSDIETIRSKKPFNVNMQLGLRLNF